MLRFGTRRRTIHIHVGPHKTGSTAIQHALQDHREKLAQDFGATAILDDSVWSFARAVNSENDAKADAELKSLLAHCGKHSGDLLISCEDLAGHMPGRGNTKRVYGYLWPNLNRLRKAFRNDDVNFYFFVRDPDKWLRSNYVQLLKYRSKFQSYEDFIAFMRDLDDVWDSTLERVRDRLGESFIEIPYEEGPDFSASQAFLTTVLGPKAAAILPAEEKRPNTAPSADVIRFLERANKSGASGHAVQTAKRFMLGPETPTIFSDDTPPITVWPPVRDTPDWLAPDLEALWTRVTWRAPAESQTNLMPDPFGDLSDYRLRTIGVDGDLPDVGRERMEDQAVILRHRLKGLPETCYLLGLAISYLRRNTGHEGHASQLFQRLWTDEYPILLGFLPTRWIISTFQTFMDHGVNEDQRAIGAAGFFMTNTLKMYEAERALEGLPSDNTYANTTPVTRAGFWGLDRYGVGGTDMLLNTNALFLELAAKEPLAGRVAQEFLLRVKKYDTAYSRMDNSRIKHQIDKPPFSDCWSFFEPPKKDRKKNG